MWRKLINIDPADIERLRSAGGDQFAAFLNDLIRTITYSRGIPGSCLALNLQTTVGDGGVDAEVNRQCIDDPDGLLDKETAWQFKATVGSSVGPSALRSEINKPRVVKRIKDGYRFVVVICDQLTASARASRMKALVDESVKIDKSAVAPVILDANDLARLASRYPSLAINYFRHQIGFRALTLDEWAPSAREHTGQYLTSKRLAEPSGSVIRHADYAIECPSSALVISGEPGIGKSRLVFEALSSVVGASKLVLYVPNAHSLTELLTYLVNLQLTALVVADDISQETLDQSRSILDGHMASVRLIAIQSILETQGERDKRSIYLEGPSNIEVDAILEENFPLIAPDRRRAYSYYAGSYLRFAIELCARDGELSEADLVPDLGFVLNYLRTRLHPDDHDALQAVSLVGAVGWQNEHSSEVALLCSMLGLNARKIRDACTEMRKASGFIAVAGRFWHVVPHAVERECFRLAWERWCEEDINGFLHKISATPFFERFLRQASKSPVEKIRKSVADFSLGWVQSLTSGHIADEDVLDRLITLIEVSPSLFSPELVRLVTNASSDELARTDGPSGSRNAKWQLVKIAQLLATFADHFDDAEEILHRLAIAEDPGIYQSEALKAYYQLFKVYLSGTPHSFEYRLGKLKRRLRSQDSSERKLAIHTVGEAISLHHSRGMDAPIAAGRMVPPDWLPQKKNSLEKYYGALVDELIEVVTNGTDEEKREVWKCSLEKFGLLVDFGLGDRIQSLLPPSEIPLVVRSAIVNHLTREKSELDEIKSDTGKLGDHLTALRGLVSAYLIEYTPTLPAERLEIAMNSDEWDSGAILVDSPWRLDVQKLASSYIEGGTQFGIDIAPWKDMVSNVASIVGEEFGKKDESGVLLDEVLRLVSASDGAFGYGYLYGYCGSRESPSTTVSEMLSELCTSRPISCFYLSVNLGNRYGGLDRALELVRIGAVGIEHIGSLAWRSSRIHLTDDQFRRSLDLLELGNFPDNTEKIAIVELAFLSSRLKTHAGLLADPFFLGCATRSLNSVAQSRQRKDHDWKQLLSAVAERDKLSATRAAIDALNSWPESEAGSIETLLVEIAMTDPTMVLREFGSVIMDPDRQLTFSEPKRSKLANSISSQDLEKWLDEHGVESARQLAQHAGPLSFPDESSRELPNVAKVVLARYGTDEGVIENIARALINERFESVDLKLKEQRDLVIAMRQMATSGDRWAVELARRIEEKCGGYQSWHSESDREDDERRLGIRPRKRPPEITGTSGFSSNMDPVANDAIE